VTTVAITEKPVRKASFVAGVSGRPRARFWEMPTGGDEGPPRATHVPAPGATHVPALHTARNPGHPGIRDVIAGQILSGRR
jgi:hypothetical protein